MNNERGIALKLIGGTVVVFFLIALALEAHFGPGAGLPMFLLVAIMTAGWLIIVFVP